MKALILISILAFVIYSCKGPDPEERYRAGYSDGYATGYNTACKIRATMVEGDWGNPDYNRGYGIGERAGRADCYHKDS